MNQYCYFRTSLRSAAELTGPLQALAAQLSLQTHLPTHLFRRVDTAKPYATWMIVFSGVNSARLTLTKQLIESALAEAGLATDLLSEVQVETFEAVADGIPK